MNENDPMDQIDPAPYFTRADGSYLFARWNRPVAPVAFGIEDATLEVLKSAIASVLELAGHPIAETDPELGANFLIFFFREWDELVETPNLDRMIDDLGPLVERLKAADANQYRVFRFDPEGGIKACFAFVRMDEVMAAIPAQTICLGQAVQAVLLWSDEIFVGGSPLATIGDDVAILKPQVAAVIRAGYDPVLPPAATDPSHALRLAARITAGQT